jgi:signal transduction histidine kinase
MPKDVLEAGCADSAGESNVDRFYANMATALHAMAQPLTVLRSAVISAAAPAANPSDQRRYLEISAEQVERACRLFQSLQQLLVAHQMEAELAPVELAVLLPPVIENQTATLKEADVEMQAVIPDGLRPVLGDMDRTLQALFGVLQIAASVSRPGDVVEFVVTPRKKFVELVVQNRRAHGRRLTSTDRLNLILAETNIRSQQGEVELAEDPFRASLLLPLLDVGQDIDA